MNRLSNVLSAMIVVFSVSGLTGSERPFFDESTQQAMKKSAKYYGYGYLGAWGVGNGINVAAVTLFSPIAVIMSMVSKDDKLLMEALSPFDNIRKGNRDVCRGLAKSTIVTAPLYFGAVVAYHKYQQSKSLLTINK
jgi:hypothetical protein